ncbi:hypothetical protein CDL15_Pgr008405 [Punica granatum]|uniref:SANT domain-containing protein n=1 Tax=Punica granatum TaxID=22663 RepID=A0A218WMM9_PUNGR|nr:hypothetical protein CDL15_Pgr008405 [Punica granatum]
MDLVAMSSNGDCIEDSIAEVLLPSESEQNNRYNVFGEPEVLPRIGDEYQAEIPDLITGPKFIRLKLDPFDDPTIGCSRPHIFHMGLPISVMWIPQTPDNVKHEQQESVAGTCDSSIKTDGLKSDHKIKLEESGNLVLGEEARAQMCKRCAEEGCLPVPGSVYNLWNDPEGANFLLGLYIFGKNLILVKKFMENKSIGQIMSFYYGKFYGSAKYRRWSMCRKMKSRRSIYGQKIFTGLRQQELLSRLLSKVSEESHRTLVEAVAGLRTLVEAIGIGKGKQDLTGIGNDHTKSGNQTAPLCPEIPIGKACSALTTVEIVTFLTGNFRLSKARSNDLFWEAVWPRLLARGWHSEQPENGISAGSRHSLVFLVPGVKKFSKRKLVKGDHYFDSVSDVLNRVASQPGLLDLDAQPNAQEGSMSKEGEVQWANEVKSDGEDSPDEERRCYLKPRTPTQCGDGIKFTIVDTSMAVNGRGSKLRELRSLPPDITSFSFRSHFEEDNGDVGSNSGDDASNLSMEEADVSKSVKVNNGDKRVSSQQKDVENNDLSSTNHQKKVSEFQPRQRTKPKSKKRQKLDVSNCALRSCSGNEVSEGARFEQEAASCCSSNPHMVVDGIRSILQVGPSPETLSSTNSPAKDITVMSGHEQENLHGPWSVIDLNLPVYPDAEFTGQGVKIDAQHDTQAKPPPHDSNRRKSPSHPENLEQQPNNGRRQSTRNRPLTMKALEALAFGLFETKRKRKNRDEFQYEMASRPPSRRAPSRARHDDESYSAGFVDLSMEDKGSDDRGNESMLSEKLSGFSL